MRNSRKEKEEGVNPEGIRGWYIRETDNGLRINIITSALREVIRLLYKLSVAWPARTLAGNPHPGMIPCLPCSEDKLAWPPGSRRTKTATAGEKTLRAMLAFDWLAASLEGLANPCPSGPQQAPSHCVFFLAFIYTPH